MKTACHKFLLRDRRFQRAWRPVRTRSYNCSFSGSTRAHVVPITTESMCSESAISAHRVAEGTTAVLEPVMLSTALGSGLSSTQAPGIPSYCGGMQPARFSRLHASSKETSRYGTCCIGVVSAYRQVRCALSVTRRVF